MRRCRGAGLAGLAALLLVAAGRAQVQQQPSAETTEGTAISINCSHINIQTRDMIYWYRQLPGRGPAFLVSALKVSKELPDPPGWLRVAADGRSSALWLARPRRGDAAVYYCALGDTGRGAGAAAGQEPPRAGLGMLGDRPKEACLEQQGGTFAPPSGLCFGGLFDLAEAEEVKVQASGPSGWQVPGHRMKGECDMVLIFLAALVELADFGEM
ncbi:uncharacterized protein [Numenius arquata]|uniref:uncharacterized protein n=1 Tax=Numenius arquata TaxID=31919 RepID=UPI003D303F7A